MMNDIYELSELKLKYNDSVVLDIERMRIPEGSSFGIFGPNGSGKSTLLKILAFLLAPSEGRVFYRGRLVGNNATGLRREVTMMTQDSYLLKRTVLENVVYGLKVRGDSADKVMRAGEALSFVGLDFEKFKNRGRNQVSGGEAQRVALAARLILRPKVLILDEPTANLDEASATYVKDAALRARDEWGTTLVIVSHDHEWLKKTTDSLTEIRNGKMTSS